MRIGTRTQLFLPLLTVVAVMLLVIGIVVWETVRRERRQLQLRLNDIVSTIDQAHFPLTEAVLRQMKGLTGAEFYLIRPGHSAISTLAELSEPPWNLATSRTDAGNDRSETLPVDGIEYFVRRHQRPIGDKQHDGQLLILYPVSRWNESVAAAVRPVLTFGLGGLLIATVMTLFLGQRFVRRIHDLEAQTRRIAAGDFQPMPLPSRADELRDLAASVNHMAEQLQSMHHSLRDAERWRVLGQMSGGLAHQMRNGVAGAKLALQLFERESSQPLDEPFCVAQRQLTLIETQLQRFLELGRRPHEPMESVNPAEVAKDAINLLMPRCRHIGIRLDAQIAESLPVIQSERGQLLQLMINLMDNAVEAAGPGGQVQLQIGVVDQRIGITVSDTGPGPPPAIADQLFEPFVTGRPNGIGLGLAVVRKIVDALQGEVTWDRVDQRSRFRVLIPVNASNPVSTQPLREHSFA